MRKLNIVLLGYGRMGKEIENIALEKSHHIIAHIDIENDWIEQLEKIKSADVAIDFSVPESVERNINKCFEIGLPIVVGTTGWYEHLEDIKKNCINKNAAMLWASNFSLGMNMFFKINGLLAEMAAKFPEYKAHIHEIHHTQKLDAPSGTAITIADGIIAKSQDLNEWSLESDLDIPSSNILPVSYERKGQVPGTHIVNYHSEIDEITIKHEAKNRKGFAIGAVLAAEWLIGRKGFYNMSDVLK